MPRLVLLALTLPVLHAFSTPFSFVRRQSPLANADDALVVDSAAQAVAIDSSGFLRSTAAVNTEACTKLKNAGSYFTAKIKVGTDPGKTFDVVADTGSNSVIVTSCQCAISGTCTTADRCFNSTDSKTLHVNQTKDGKVPVVTMGFGSGTIEAEIGSDKVAIGSVTADMDNQLLLMVDKALNLQGKFEGILGLGIPEDATDTISHPPAATGDKSVKTKDTKRKYHTKGFLEEAGLTRFSICFQDNGDGGNNDGTLRVDTPALTNPLGSVGSMHWGLDFRGISVGNTTAPVSFCTAAELEANPALKTPCGAIPDSGTTLILGPRAQLITLYEDICDSWPRCTEAWALLPTLTLTSKADLVETLLANCSGWINSTEQGLDEMPELNFHLKGSEGTDQIISFKGSQYIESGELDPSATASGSFEKRTTLKQEPAVEFLRRQQAASQSRQFVCLPAMGTMEYATTANGAVWILGTPLFYAYQVSFEAATSPPSIQISKDPCTSCSSALEEGPPEVRSRSPRKPRRIQGEARGPSIPLSGPL